MKFEKGYIYDFENGRQLVFITSYYDGDITGFGNTEYIFVDYNKKDNFSLDVNNVISYNLKCYQSTEDVIGKCVKNENIIPYNIEYKKIVQESYEFSKKKPKIIYE